MKIISIVKKQNTKKIKLFGLTICKIEKRGANKRYYILGILVFIKNNITIFYRKYKKLFNNYNNICILNSNIGEAYLVFKYFANGIISNETLFIATKPCHVEIIKTFLPSCNYILETKISAKCLPDNFRVNEKFFTVLFNSNYYEKLERDIREEKKDAHYYKRMKSFFNFSKEIMPNKVNIADDVQKSLDEKLKKVKLNLDNFIFIAPEANTCLDIEDSVLEKVNNSFKNAGFDVFWNIINPHKNFANYKTTFLSLQEIMLLCSKAKAIISLRSGLAEFLTETQIPMYVLYSKLKNREPNRQMNVCKVLKGFTLSQLPNYRENIKEYIAKDESDYHKHFDEIFREICKV